MDNKLFKAILAMDSYNRGYDQVIELGANQEGDSIGLEVGNAIIIAESDIDESSTERNASFYAVAYQINGGETVISYRGTDNLPLDSFYGFGVATGSTGVTQAEMAFAFYNAVATELNGNISIHPQLADISLTGHSLGGGLAGYVGANDNVRAERDAV